jgi:hypothetical protein
VNVPVNITGVQSTLKDMRKFNPDLAKQMNTQIKNAMMPIRDKSRALAPGNSEMLSGWTGSFESFATTKYRAFPNYDQSEVTKGIIYRQGANTKGEVMGAQFKRRFQVTHYIANTSAGGAIYETSGRLSSASKPSRSLNPNARSQFLAPLGPLYGSRGGGNDPRFGNTDQRGRLIYRAWHEDQGRAAHAVNLAIRIAVAKFNAQASMPTVKAAK